MNHSIEGLLEKDGGASLPLLIATSTTRGLILRGPGVAQVAFLLGPLLDLKEARSQQKVDDEN